MRFMIMVRATRDTEAGRQAPESLFAEMAAYHEALAKAGVLLDGAGLHPSAKGWRVRYAGEKRTLVDGPFAETKELIAGFAMMQFASRQEAVDWAKRFVEVDAPARENGTAVCEVRPTFEIEDFPVSPEEKPGGWREVESNLRDQGKIN